MLNSIGIMIDKSVVLPDMTALQKRTIKQTIKIGETNYVKNYWY